MPAATVPSADTANRVLDRIEPELVEISIGEVQLARLPMISAEEA
jgi:hypothetical protein